MKFAKVLCVITAVSALALETACKKPTINPVNPELIAPREVTVEEINTQTTNSNADNAIVDPVDPIVTVKEVISEPVATEPIVEPVAEIVDQTIARSANQQPIGDSVGNLGAEKKSKVAKTELNDVNFDLDAAAIRELDKDNLQKVANYLKENPNIKMQIAGNCDERGTNEYNLSLGERRAYAARNYLINLGVDEGRLSTISYGKEKPKVHGHNEASWLINRNCQFLPR